MKSNYREYDYLKSFERIDGILDTSDSSYEERDSIPNRDTLSYSNGYYVEVSALFADIRSSSSLTDIHRRPKLAKLYRAFISEVVAVINGNPFCAEVNIIGDCVSGIFNSPSKVAVNSVLCTAAEISSLIDVIDCKFKKRNVEQIKVGIGISDGKALMIKAGYPGSGINDIVWVGDVVNEACHLSGYDIRGSGNHEIRASESVFRNLVPQSQKLLKWDYICRCYRNSLADSEMQEWFIEHCK